MNEESLYSSYNLDHLGGCPRTGQGWKQFYCQLENFKFPEESALK